MNILSFGLGFGLGYFSATTGIVTKILNSGNPPLEILEKEIKIFGYTIIRK